MSRIILFLCLVIMVMVSGGPGMAADGGVGNKHGRALSLKVLQERVEACGQGTTCAADVMQLADLGRLEGYVIDPTNRDLILVGQLVEGAPPLYLEDFVIALRDAWRLYGHYEGKTFYYSDPGCSIDPHPKVIQELQRTGQYLQGHPSPAGREDALDYWHQVCHMPQQVRVLGIPFNTHFAKVMVDADYFMKKLVDGSETVHGFEFHSLTDLHVDAAEQAMKQGKRTTVATDTMSRFWFHAGRTVLLEDVGMVEIKQVPIELLTEQEHLSKKSRIVGSGHPDPLAKRWAKTFTDHYGRIANEYPIYREIENLYRVVALARSMKLRNAWQSAGLDLVPLVEDFQVQETTVASTLPGHSNIRTERYQHAVVNGYAETTLTMPSCGGVDAGVAISEKSFERDRSKQLIQKTRAVLVGRNTAAQLYWDF